MSQDGRSLYADGVFHDGDHTHGTMGTMEGSPVSIWFPGSVDDGPSRFG